MLPFGPRARAHQALPPSLFSPLKRARHRNGLAPPRWQSDLHSAHYSFNFICRHGLRD